MNTKFALVLFLFLIPLAGWTETISIGGTSLDVPNPPGFARVTPEMKAVYTLQQQLVPPMNEQFANYIVESEVSKAVNNEMPDLARSFSVQTGKSIVTKSVSSSQFAELKQIMKTQNEELTKSIEKEMPGMMEKMSEGINKEFDVNIALSLSRPMLMPPHDETDRTLAFSSIMKYELKDAAGNSTPDVASVTTTLAHVKGKVLFLYATGEKDDLEWGRKISKQWSDAVIAANPSDLQSSVKEALPPAVSGINWNQVLEKAVIGALIGLIAGLAGYLLKGNK